jgi:hypothetical protein
MPKNGHFSPPRTAKIAGVVLRRHIAFEEIIFEKQEKQ